MSHDDDDYNRAGRRQRDWGEDDDFPPPRRRYPPARPTDPAVLTIAVLGFVLAGLHLLGGLGCVTCGGFLVSALSGVPRPAGGGGGGPFAAPEWVGVVIVGLGVGLLVHAGLLITGGVGLLNRKPLGRWLTVVAGVAAVLLGATEIGLTAYSVARGPGAPGAVFANLIYLGPAALQAGYGVAALIVMFLPRVAAEFRPEGFDD